MNYLDLIHIRDHIIIREFLNQCPENERQGLHDKLTSAITSAEKELYSSQLPIFVGNDVVIKMQKRLKEKIIKQTEGG